MKNSYIYIARQVQKLPKIFYEYPAKMFTSSAKNTGSYPGLKIQLLRTHAKVTLDLIIQAFDPVAHYPRGKLDSIPAWLNLLASFFERTGK